MACQIITVFSTRLPRTIAVTEGNPDAECRLRQFNHSFLMTKLKKMAEFQIFTVNAPAFVPAWVSPLVTLTFHRPVAAPAGIFTVQVIFF